MFTTAVDFYHFFQLYLFRGKTRQIAHTSSPSRSIDKKLYYRVTLLRQLADSGWGADAKPLCAAALSPIYSTAEDGAQVWSRSAHTRFIDSVLCHTLRIVTGCLRSSRTKHLPSSSQLSLVFTSFHYPNKSLRSSFSALATCCYYCNLISNHSILVQSYYF